MSKFKHSAIKKHQLLSQSIAVLLVLCLSLSERIVSHASRTCSDSGVRNLLLINRIIVAGVLSKPISSYLTNVLDLVSLSRFSYKQIVLT